MDSTSTLQGVFYSDHVEVNIFGLDDLAPEQIEVYIAADDDRVFETSLSPKYAMSR
ncbi:MAG: hypothetical protein KUG77_18305 [Nannocystaceae bacterium]|nr:hypothetical protein [Nannocystaceae bacterium]